MPRCALLLLLSIFLVVRADSHPLKTANRPNIDTIHARDSLIDFLDNDVLDGAPGGYATYSLSETSTYPYGGLFPDELQTSTGGQSQSANTATTSPTSVTSTHTLSKPQHTSTTPTTTPALTTSETSSASPSSSGFSPPNAVETSSMPRSEAAQWKVIGLVVICITFVGVAILTIVFFDAWWSFVRALVCRRRHGGGKEDMVPDWEKRSWEYKLPTDDNRRQFPVATPSAESLVGNASVVRLAMGRTDRTRAGVGRGGVGQEQFANPFEPHPRGLLVSPQPMYTPGADRHPLEPLTRRPSTNSGSCAYP